MRVRARGKRRRLLVSHVDPPHVLPAPNRFRDAVERVARNPVDPLDASGDEGIPEQVRDVLLGHGALPSFPPRSLRRFARPQPQVFCASMPPSTTTTAP